MHRIDFEMFGNSIHLSTGQYIIHTATIQPYKQGYSFALGSVKPVPCARQSSDIKIFANKWLLWKRKLQMNPPENKEVVTRPFEEWQQIP